jgi:hypothetical protein
VTESAKEAHVALIVDTMVPEMKKMDAQLAIEKWFEARLDKQLAKLCRFSLAAWCQLGRRPPCKFVAVLLNSIAFDILSALGMI